MKTNLFFYILKKINNYEKLNSYLDVFKIIPRSKFEILQFYIIKGLLTHEQKEHIWDLFNKAQKIYLGFQQFAFLYKFKKSSFFEMEKDLLYNSLEKYPENQKITILHKNKKYIFRLTDLMKCWKKALTHSNELFPEILDLKNPYTNIPFLKHNLYNIFFKIYFSNFKIPFLIQEFFNLNFNKRNFSTKFSIILKDIAIINCVDAADIEELREDVQSMFEKYYRGEEQLDFYLDEKRTRELLKILKNYIYLYYIVLYTRNIEFKKMCEKTLNRELNCFIKYNTSFFRIFFDGNIRNVSYGKIFKNILFKIFVR